MGCLFACAAGGDPRMILATSVTVCHSVSPPLTCLLSVCRHGRSACSMGVSQQYTLTAGYVTYF